MKKYPFYFTVLCLTVISLFFTECKKHTDDPLLTGPLLSDITLHDKSLPVIKRYVSGKWKLEYTYGGFIANQRTDFHGKNYIWQIDKGSHINQWYMGHLITNSSIKWYQYTYGGGDKIFEMKFYNDRMYPYNYVIYGIVNDSLVLRDFSDDAMIYHFSKQN